MSGLFVAAWRLFISRRFAVGLLIIIGALLVPGVLLPTPVLHTAAEVEALQQNNPALFQLVQIFDPPAIAGSWTFLLLNAALLVSTVLCSIERIRNRDFKDPLGREPQFFREKRAFHVATDQNSFAAGTQALLRRARWRVNVTEDKERIAIFGQKGAWGFWGSIVFHLGFLALMVGVVISANTRLNATVLVTEKQTFSLKEGGFAAISRMPNVLSVPDISIHLDRVQAEYEQGKFPTDYRSHLTFSGQSGEKKATVGVNEAYTYAGLLFLMENYGYSPTFIVTDQTDKEVFKGVVNLKSRSPEKTDSFTVQEAGLQIESRFFPDYQQTGPRQAANGSLEPLNPAYLIQADLDGAEAFSGPIKLNEKIDIGSYSLEFSGLRRWSYLRVNRDGGVDIMFWGLVAAVTGLVVRFILHERSIYVVTRPEGEGTHIVLAGKSRYFPALFAEDVEKMAESLKRIEGQ